MRKFLVGAVLAYVGLLLYAAGAIIEATPIPALNDAITASIPLGLTVALLGAILRILSGLVGVTGLLLCIADVSKPTPPPVTIIQQIPAPPPATRTPTPTTPPAQSSTCKYCGHYIQPNETFCPTCNRAQK